MEYHASGSLPLLGRPRYCPGANANGGYLCETGHCCGESGCCTYYYELWWFWLLWTVLILFSCCCAYRHRRAKLRVQQQQRQRDISLLAYQGASSFPSSMLDLSFLASLKLPSYEEVAAQPSTPPPPYSSVFTAPRYPQPPRTAHPHLLSQHPGAAPHSGAPHRCLQPLSDGPSSLSSDNSSSCSCDSCCPSSPCSSSLSAPVTYETDTSHASTPSEAAPLALDPVAMETISAAAARLSSKDPPAAVAILIDQTDPAATECVTAVAAGSASPSDSTTKDSVFPVGITGPIKQQLDVVTATGSGTDASSNPTRTLENTSFQQPRTLALILDSAGGNTDKNPSLVPISVSPQNPPRAALPNEKTDIPETSPNTSPSQTSPCSRTVHKEASLSPKFTDCSPPSQGTAHFSLKPAGESSESTAEAKNVTKQSEESGNLLKSPSVTVETTSQAPVCSSEDSLLDIFELGKQTVELSKSTEVLTTNQANEKVSETSNLSQTPQHSSESVFSPLESSHLPQISSELCQNLESLTPTSAPVSIRPNLTPEPTTSSLETKSETPDFVETRELTTTQPEPLQNVDSVSISMPEPSNFECPPISRENILPGSHLYVEIPPETTPAKANDLATDVALPTLDRETGKFIVTNLEVEQKSVELLNLAAQNENPNVPEASAIVQSFNLQTDVLPTIDRDTAPDDSELHPVANLTSQDDDFVKSHTFDQEKGKLSEPLHLESSNPHDSSLSTANSLTADVTSATLDRGKEKSIAENFELEQTPVELKLEHSQNECPNSTDASSVFPATTVQTRNVSLSFDGETTPVDLEALNLGRPVANLAAQEGTLNVFSPTLDQEKGKFITTNLEVEQKPVNFLNLAAQKENPTSLDASSALFPAITVPTRNISPTFDRETTLVDLELLCPVAILAAQDGNLNVMLPTLERENEKLFVTNSEVEQNPREHLTLEHSLANLAAQNENPTSPDASAFPAITIQADPPSFAASPCSIPSLPQSPTSAMLLLDPLSALQPSDKSAMSSGHASSLSPSPRNTQSPPKQTLFSPCVDVFEPVNPNWEDDESEEQNDEEYCEDSDVAADESQYRHRRLTGDSGIEVCRCRVEDEEEEEEEELEKAQDGGEKVGELHDSVDCPGRSRRSSLCNSESSSEKVAIPLETV